MNHRHVAVLIPCLNEEKSVGKVVRDFKRVLPAPDIYVFYNGSTDDTALIARQEGAIVLEENRRGKGYVVQSMFRTVDSDIYVLVDGDDTYPADAMNELLEPVLVLRETTERPEATEAGTARLVGTDRRRIRDATQELLDDEVKYNQMARAANPFGDGKAAQRIADVLQTVLREH